MSETFHKFPHTPHLLWLGEGTPREDKILPPGDARAFLEGPVIVEEKVDGANLGLSIGPDGRVRAQSRGNYLAPGRSHAQWNPLWPWLAQREQALVNALGDELMLFGEWAYALHTISYSSLPAWFLAFDIYEPKNDRFWSVANRNTLAEQLGMETVPEVFRGRLAMNQVAGLIGASLVGAPRMEGLYLRHETNGYLKQRSKVVSADFKQRSEEHWTRRALVANRLYAAKGSRTTERVTPTLVNSASD